MPKQTSEEAGVQHAAALKSSEPFGPKISPVPLEELDQIRNKRDARIIEQIQQQFKVVVEMDSDGWLVASDPKLAGCHTQARSAIDLYARIQEAIGVSMEVTHS